MDSLCLKTTGIHGAMGSSISVTGGLEARTTPSQVSAVGRSASEKKTAPFSRLRSLWLNNKGGGGGGSSRYNGLAVDDAVLAENEGKVGVEEEKEEREGSDNWVLKILHVRSLWRERSAGIVEEEGGDVGIDERVVGDEECEVCRVDDDGEEEKVEFDRDSFSRLLRRVSLAEASLYAQMSYLGNLAYSIPSIKVRPNCYVFFDFGMLW
jgi:hypothetical protein